MHRQDKVTAMMISFVVSLRIGYCIYALYFHISNSNHNVSDFSTQSFLFGQKKMTLSAKYVRRGIEGFVTGSTKRKRREQSLAFLLTQKALGFLLFSRPRGRKGCKSVNES